MGSNEPFSLFSQGSQPEKSPLRKEKIKIEAPPPAKKKPIVDTDEKRAERRAKIYKDPQVKEWIEKIEGLHKEIDDKIHHLLDQKGLSPASVKRYLEDPSNFDPVQLEMIRNGRDALESTIGSALGANMKMFKQTKVNAQVTKGRKGKTLGGRKKWMDMR